MRNSPPRIVLALLAIDALLALAYVVDAVSGRPFERLSHFLDLGGEGNLPAWFSSVQWLLCGAVFAVFALRNVRWTVRRSWALLLLPCLFVALSLDEVAQIHEWLGHRSDRLLEGGSREASILPATGVWMFVVGGPFVVMFLTLLLGVRPYFSGARCALDKVCLGMMVMLAGAIGVETLRNFVVAGSGLATAQVAAEELLEMVGSTLVFWGGLTLLAIHGFSVHVDPVAQTAPARVAQGSRRAA